MWDQSESVDLSRKLVYGVISDRQAHHAIFTSVVEVVNPEPLLALVPASGGSCRGILGKNLARISDMPLISKTISILAQVLRIDRVLVSTDDPSTAAVARINSAEVHERSPELADQVTLSTLALAVVDALRFEGVLRALPAHLTIEDGRIRRRGAGSLLGLGY